ncbi:MAG: efflux RND transporter permease subunit, partial [Planctomycetota bacterium]
ATLTTVVVFIPILLIEEEAGQLFRDIALAIVAAVALSLVVSITVIPVSAARFLSTLRSDDGERRGLFSFLTRPFAAIPGLLSRFVYVASGSTMARLAIVAVLTVASVAGTILLLPPTDYLPQGNRNLIFGLMIPPPGYNLEQREELARRVEETIAPFWEAGRDWEPGQPQPDLPPIPTFNWATMGPGEPITPPPLENYFFVSIENVMFHGGISADPERVVDVGTLFNHSTRGDVAPGVMAFAFQVPLFRLGGTTGSAVKINFIGDDLDQVSSSALVTLMDLMGKYGPRSVVPDPSNFNVPGPELQVDPDLVRLAEIGMSPTDLGQAVQVLGDGAIVGDYRRGGKTIDLRIVTHDHRTPGALAKMEDAPIATPGGGVVPLGCLGDVSRVNAAVQINRSSRRRSVTLQFTAPSNLPLEAAIADIEGIIAAKRAAGVIPPEVETSYTGSASKLQAVRTAMLGDGTLYGTAASSLVLALVIVYLLLCVLFQSFLQPLIILFSVPLATLGGFAALSGVHTWSQMDPYMPDQKLDVLTMLGFVILIGVVVNNAILIVHQTANFLRGEGGEPMGPRRAIAEAVKSRVRPIFMGTFTSLGGMAPLVFMPGSGSELYRGLGSVVIGGLLVSTIFTLLLVPMLLSLVLSLQERLGLLRTGAHDDGSESSRAPAAAGVMALLLFALAPGCATAEREDGLEKTLRSIAERHVQSDMEGEGTVQLERGELRLAEPVRKRLDELEKLGGTASWSSLDPVLPPGLDGRGPDARPVSLEDAVHVAAERNLGVRFLRLQRAVETEGITVEEAAFDAVFFADATFDRIDEPQAVPQLNGISLGSNERGSRRASIESGVSRRLESGATVSAAARMEHQRNKTPGIGMDPDPGHWAGLTLEARQPLLRGAGAEINRSGVTLQESSERRSREDVHESLLQLVADVEEAYWDLVESWSLLRIQEELVRRGEETERVLRERSRFDANPAEWSDAIATVEFRRADRVRLQRRVQAASDRLQLIVNRTDHRLLDGALLVPSKAFQEASFSFDARESARRAVAERPLVRRAVLEIEDADVRERLAENGKLPQLDLVAGLAVTGLDDTTYSSVSSVGRDDHYGYTVGLAFNVPIGNRAAEAELRRAELRRDGSFLRYENVVRSVVQDVKSAVRDLQASWDLIGAARQFRISQTENLRALLLEEGQRSSLTPEFLALKLQRQERLATAQAQEVAAMGDFHRARARYRRAVGTGLGMERIVLEMGE